MSKHSIKEITLDIRDARCVLTGVINEKLCSVIIKNDHEISYSLNKNDTKTSLFYTNDGVFLNEYAGQEPATKVTNFLKTGKVNAKTPEGKPFVKDLDEIINDLVNCVKLNTDMYIDTHINLVNLLKTDQVHDSVFQLIKAKILEVYELGKEQLKETVTERMISLDLGTGFYIGMIHEMNGNYESFEKGFFVNGKSLKHDLNPKQKVKSDVYVNPSFDLSLVPRYIKQNQIEKILDNTSISSSQNDWVQIQHYKKFLYTAPKDLILVNPVELCSNIQIKVPGLHFDSVDVLHVFIVLMLHIKTALTKDKITYARVRFSVPITAEKMHKFFMLSAAKSVFGENVQLTTEPEAAVSYMISCQNEEDFFSKYNHILLMDGGDGTFDYIMMKKHIDQKDKIIWSECYGTAYTNAGAILYVQFMKIMTQQFEHLDNFTRQFFNDLYDDFRQKTGAKEVTETTQYEFLIKIQKNFIETQKFIMIKLVESSQIQIFCDGKIQNASSFQQLLLNQPIEKIIQTAKIIMKNETIQNIISPINQLLADLHQTKKNMDDLKVDYEPQNTIVVFVGGLAANKTIMQKMKAVVQNEMQFDFLSHEFPQTVIPSGISINRANITLRDYDKQASNNLYFLSQKIIPGIKINTVIKSTYQNRCIQFSPQMVGQSIRAVPSLFLQKGTKLAPGNNKIIDQLRMHVNQPVTLVFFKSKYDAIPEFFNLEFSNNEAKFKVTSQNFWDNRQLYSVTVQISKDDVAAFDCEYAKNLTQNLHINAQIDVQVHLVFDFQQFNPNPSIQIYIEDKETKNLQLIKEIDIWSWYDQNIAENQLSFETIKK